MRLATWNVNSMNVRLPHVLEWLATVQPDVLCLQETKQEDHKFPYEALRDAGYQAVHAGQKTYNGVAILSRHDMTDVQMGMPGWDDPQQRLISATINGIRIMSAYVPNGQSVGSEKYDYKLAWLHHLQQHLANELARYPQLAILGDYNIAPDDRDVFDPNVWHGQVLVSEAERASFQQILNLGLYDSFRLFDQPDGAFSWWDYRMAAFRRNLGVRIDHILVNHSLKHQCEACWVDKAPRKLERPSDHAPVVLQLKLA